jgi:hypothetical protein
MTFHTAVYLGNGLLSWSTKDIAKAYLRGWSPAGLACSQCHSVTPGTVMPRRSPLNHWSLLVIPLLSR